MRVVLAIDGSEPGKIAIDLVANIAWPARSEVLVAEAVDTGAAIFGGPWPALAMVEAERIEQDLRTEAQQTVDGARARLSRPGLRIQAEVLRGRPAAVVDARARQLDADLIVVGSRGHGTIESMLLGSVSAELIGHAVSPVLVARSRQLERVVLAWDGSTAAARGADMLRTWPIFAGSTVRVVSVADLQVPWWAGFPESGFPELGSMYVDATAAGRSRHERLALDMSTGLQAAGIAAIADHRDGDAAMGILAAAAAARADLIVMGTRGRTTLARLVLGSVARNVVHHATCSVLVARAVGQ